MNEFVEKRHIIAKRYEEELGVMPIKLPWQSPDGYSSYHLYVVRLNLRELVNTHKGIYRALCRRGINVNLHYIPVYLHPYYRRMGFNKGYCLEAERYFADALSIPMYPALSDDDQRRVIDELKSIIKV